MSLDKLACWSLLICGAAAVLAPADAADPAPAPPATPPASAPTAPTPPTPPTDVATALAQPEGDARILGTDDVEKVRDHVLRVPECHGRFDKVLAEAIKCKYDG